MKDVQTEIAAYAAPQYLVDAIKAISNAVELVMGENLADDGNGIYEGTSFTLKSFSVDEDYAPLFIWHSNGEYKFHVTWWQHVGRGTYATADLDLFTVTAIAAACLDEIMQFIADEKFNYSVNNRNGD